MRGHLVTGDFFDLLADLDIAVPGNGIEVCGGEASLRQQVRAVVENRRARVERQGVGLVAY
jgi:hypothetical protein